MSILYELISFTDEELTQEYELPSGEKKKPTEMSRREIEELFVIFDCNYIVDRMLFACKRI